MTSGETQSIAVLPFVNMSDDSDHFADGLSEELMNLLAKNPDLDVAGRTSSFAFKGKTGGFAEIGNALNVEHVLEGSVRRSGDTLRVTAQLIRADNGFHLWSETYDRMMTDIFEIQDDVAGAISNELKLRLVPESKRVTESIEAYALYLESMAMTFYDDSADAIDLLKRAVALDPGFAKAYEKLALAYWLGAGAIMTSEDAVRFIRESAERALEIDPSLVIAEVIYASTSDESITSIDYLEKLEFAAESEPKNGRVLDMLANALLRRGYYRESLAINDRYVALEPLSTIPYFSRGRILGALGRREESRAAYGRVVELGEPGAYGSISFDHFVAGEYDEGIEIESKFREHLGQDPSLVRYEVERILDPDTGKAFLDAWIEERVTSHPYPAFAEHEYAWYLAFGYVDELWRKIDEMYASSDSAWSTADDLVGIGLSFPLTGFRRHPDFITQDKIDLWEERGAPDTCKKINDQWTCE